MNWLKQAVTGADNHTYEGAYLALAAIIGLAALSILSILGLAYVDVILNHRDSNPAGLGGGIAAILGGLAAFLGGVGAYILMDRKQDQPQQATTTTTESTVVKTVAPVAVVPDVAVEAVALAPKITAADVGSTVAIERPTPRRRSK